LATFVITEIDIKNPHLELLIVKKITAAITKVIMLLTICFVLPGFSNNSDKKIFDLPKTKITLHIHNSDIISILRALARTGQQNIVISQSITDDPNIGTDKNNSFDIDVTNTPWDEVFVQFLERNNLTYKKNNDILKIVRTDDSYAQQKQPGSDLLSTQNFNTSKPDLPKIKTTIKLYNSDIIATFNALAHASNQDIILSPNIIKNINNRDKRMRPININVVDAPWDNVFEQIVDYYKFTFTKTDNTIRIFDENEVREKADENTSKEPNNEDKKLKIPAETYPRTKAQNNNVSAKQKENNSSSTKYFFASIAISAAIYTIYKLLISRKNKGKDSSEKDILVKIKYLNILKSIAENNYFLNSANKSLINEVNDLIMEINSNDFFNSTLKTKADSIITNCNKIIKTAEETHKAEEKRRREENARRAEEARQQREETRKAEEARRRNFSDQEYNSEKNNSSESKNRTFNKSRGSSTFDPYEILQVSKLASESEIRKAYFSLLKKYHPDRVDDMGHEIKHLATEMTKRINAAFQILKEQGRV